MERNKKKFKLHWCEGTIIKGASTVQSEN